MNSTQRKALLAAAEINRRCHALVAHGKREDAAFAARYPELFAATHNAQGQKASTTTNPAPAAAPATTPLFRTFVPPTFTIEMEVCPQPETETTSRQTRSMRRAGLTSPPPPPPRSSSGRADRARKRKAAQVGETVLFVLDAFKEDQEENHAARRAVKRAKVSPAMLVSAELKLDEEEVEMKRRQSLCTAEDTATITHFLISKLSVADQAQLQPHVDLMTSYLKVLGEMFHFVELMTINKEAEFEVRSALWVAYLPIVRQDAMEQGKSLISKQLNDRVGRKVRKRMEALRKRGVLSADDKEPCLAFTELLVLLMREPALTQFAHWFSVVFKVLSLGLPCTSLVLDLHRAHVSSRISPAIAKALLEQSPAASDAAVRLVRETTRVMGNKKCQERWAKSRCRYKAKKFRVRDGQMVAMCTRHWKI